MRITAVSAGLFLCTLIILGNSTVSADAPKTLALKESIEIESSLVALEADKEEEPKQQVAEAPKAQVHIVAGGETLSSIASKVGTSWQRLYAKNLQIADPNIIKPGDNITIPEPSEQLADRPVPSQAAVLSASSTSQTQQQTTGQSTARASVPRGSSVGNAYYSGYCTWYAKNRRPDMPNNLGNADTWVARAASQGMATGSAPRAGAIGQQGMHVVYVERVNPDGTVFISEMNYRGFGVVSTRTVPASTFRYIY